MLNPENRVDLTVRNIQMLESKFLKENLQNIQKLMTIPPLKRFETESLGKLVRLSKVREYEPGEIIIREGEEDQWIYFLLSGKVRVIKQGVPVTTIGQMGALFGEMRILDRMTRSATIKAESKTVCLSVDTSATDRLASEDERANLLLMLYRVFSEFISIRLRATTNELIQAKLQIKKLMADAGRQP